MFVERLYQSGKIQQAPAEAVDLIDDHTIDFAFFDVVHQAFERRTFQIASCESSVIIFLWEAFPAFVQQAFDVGFARFPLCVE